MNEAQEARRIAVMALVALLIVSSVLVFQGYKLHGEDEKIADAINRRVAALDARISALEKKSP